MQKLPFLNLLKFTPYPTPTLITVSPDTLNAHANLR
jgi:hypothetical protein